MCYYNGQKVTHAEFIRLKHLEKLVADYDFLNNPMKSGFDYGTHAVLKVVEGKEDFNIVEMEWGFLPPYIKNDAEMLRFRKGYTDEGGKYHTPITTLNAMGEELLKPGKMFRDAALQRRCLVLSSGFYEWRHVYPMGKKGQPLKTAITYPYRIFLPEREYFYMAGICQPWTNRDTGEISDTSAIITTAANTLMEKVHNTKKRMPVILNEDLAWEWLFGKLSEERITAIAATQYPAEKMDAYPIAKNFREALSPMEPFVYPDLPLLDGSMPPPPRPPQMPQLGLFE